jgi:hemoglobin/transferrin/lactoferrin receptor protein
MRKFLLLVLLVLTNIAYSQSGSFNGKVVDLNTNESISDVNVVLVNTQFKAKTNNSGEFSLVNISAGKYKLEVSHPGYNIYYTEVLIMSNLNTTLDIQLASNEILTGEIKVTSTRYESLIKDVSLPMEVVDEHQILRSTANTVSDILDTKPGLSLIRDGIWATDISIRGLSRNNIVTLIDGNRIETANDISARFSMIDLNDIERIEIIKGGSSSLYGTGAFGGVINVITKNYGFSDKNYFRGSLLTGYNSVNTSGTGNLSLNAGSKFWFAKISGTLRNAQNTQTPQGELKNSQFYDNSISSTLGFQPFKNHLLKLDYQRYDAKNVGIPGSSLFPTNAVVTYPEEKREMYSAEYRMSYVSKSLKNISLKYFYQTILRDVQNIPNQVVIKKAKNGNLIQKTSVDNIVPIANHYTNGIQFQTDWVIGKYNNVVVGADIWQRSLTSDRQKFQTIQNYDSTNGNLISSISKITGEKPLPEADYRSIGGYAQDEIKLFEDKMKINLGARIDQVRVTNSTTLNPAYTITNGIRSNNPSGQTVLWNATESNDVSWSGNIGALYSVVKDVDVTLNFARSFRSPSLEERYQFIDLGSYVRVGDPFLKPEKGLFGDIGLRIWKPTFNFNGNIFINSFEDLVVEKPGTFEGRQAFVKANVGKAILFGYDFDFMYNFYKSYIVYGSIAHVRGEDTENNLDLPQMPPLNSRLGLRASFYKYLIIDLSSTLFNRQDKVAPGEIPTPGYAIFNIGVNTSTIQYKFLKLQFFTGCENIFDKSYRNHLSSNRGLVSVEPGRNIYLKMNMEF